MVSGEGSARRQPEVASSAYSSSPRRNGHNLHRGGKSRFGSMMAVRIGRRQQAESLIQLCKFAMTPSGMTVFLLGKPAGASCGRAPLVRSLMLIKLARAIAGQIDSGSVCLAGKLASPLAPDPTVLGVGAFAPTLAPARPWLHKWLIIVIHGKRGLGGGRGPEPNAIRRQGTGP